MRFLILAAILTATVAHSDARQPTPVPKGKAAPKQKTDLELIQGTWAVFALETGGKSEPEKNYRGNTFTFGTVKDVATLRERGFDPIEFAYKLDPTATPKAVELTLPAKGVTFRGIYKLEGDDLTICISNGGARPTEFATKTGGDTELFTLKRDRWERYADKDFGFGVDMPGKPAERRREIDTPAGKAATTLLVVRSEMERMTYVVSVTRLPGKLDAKEAEAAKDAAKKLALAEVYPNAKVAQEERPKPPPKMGGIAVQELTLTLDLPDSKDRAAARVRLFVAGDRLYALMVAGAEEDTRSPNVVQFWNSFRQPADKKKN